MKFVNGKHSELMLHPKKPLVIIINSLCLYHHYLWGKCEDLQRKDKVNQFVFGLRAIGTIKIIENGPSLKILHEKDLMAIQECHTPPPPPPDAKGTVRGYLTLLQHPEWCTLLKWFMARNC